MADGYNAVPGADTDGANGWFFYLAVKSGQQKPDGWQDANGLPANSAFEDPIDQTIGGVTYTIYIMSLSRTQADGAIRYYPTVTPS